MMARWTLALALLLPLPAMAQDRDAVLACVAGMETEADWAACREMMFEGCAAHEVGSDGHLSCLTEDRTGWQDRLDAATEATGAALTPEGATELGQLLGQWYGFVGNKCAGVAAQRAAISEDAARLGCEISEVVGLLTELNSCRAGTSTSPYCILKAD